MASTINSTKPRDSDANPQREVRNLAAAAKADIESIQKKAGVDFGTNAAISAPGAIPVTNGITWIVTDGTAGANAFTLADGVEGQHKTIVVKTRTDGADTAVITPANKRGFATVTLDAVGDSVHLVFTDTKWTVIGGNGHVLA